MPDTTRPDTSEFLKDPFVSPTHTPYDFSAYAEEEAEKVGCVVVYPEPNQLQIDLDSEEAFTQHERLLLEFFYRGTVVKYTMDPPVVTPSKSGYPHRHITLSFHDHIFTEWERIGMQMMLGSDPVRERLNALRLASGIDRPCRLFEPKERP